MPNTGSPSGTGKRPRRYTSTFIEQSRRRTHSDPYRPTPALPHLGLEPPEVTKTYPSHRTPKPCGYCSRLLAEPVVSSRTRW